jgi:hypothetical protein
MMKLRQARSELAQLGFAAHPGRNRHETWINGTGQPRRRIVLFGSESEGIRPEQTEKLRRLRRGMMVYCSEKEEQNYGTTP